MQEKKHIDRLYQEKFKNFEAFPKEAVWNSISAKLKEKEQKRVFLHPWRYRIAGVAVAILFIVLLGENFPSAATSSMVSSDQVLKTTPPKSISTEITPKLATQNLEFVLPEDNLNEKVAVTKNLAENSVKPSENKPILGITSVLRTYGIIKFTEKEELATSQSKNTDSQKADLPSIFEQILWQSEEEKTVEATAVAPKKFEVSTRAAPIYYGNMGSGNSIDPMFANNESKGEVTFSYGVNLTYKISEKFKIRSGINKVAMSSIIQDVSYEAVMNPAAISAINYQDNFIPNNRHPVIKPSSELVMKGQRKRVAYVQPGSLNQKMGFIEVPVEVEYNLLDKTIAINLIGGASTLFLDDNMISVNVGSNSQNLGKANNINSVSFSTNIGLGVDYNLSKNFKLNLEPILKYQLNTFNAATGEYQPYYFGVYSGFSYQF